MYNYYILQIYCYYNIVFPGDDWSHDPSGVTRDRTPRLDAPGSKAPTIRWPVS